MKWGLGIFLFQGGLFLHIWGVFWVGRGAVFSIPKGFFFGWGREGVIVFKGWEAKLDNFYITSIYLIANPKVIFIKLFL